MQSDFDITSWPYYNWHRYYDPSSGRYLSVDPVVQISKGLVTYVHSWRPESGEVYTYAINNPISYTDLWGLIPPIPVPPGINIDKNVREARDMSAIDFYIAVRTGGKWDYKQFGPEYQNFGNYHLGVVAGANGWPQDVSKFLAGMYQIWSGRSTLDWALPPWMSPYGDDPMDQQFIDIGYFDFGKDYCGVQK